MRITTLVENTARADLLAEHGLAFWIQIGSRQLLFDTGQGNVLDGNARKLGVRLELADAVLLSHGHYDHTGGLADVLRMARRPKVFAHPAAFAPKYAREKSGKTRAAGMPHLDEQKVRRQADLLWTQEPTEVCEGLRLTGPVPRVTDFEDTGGTFFIDQACRQPDDLPDDQAAFLDTPSGTVVILGCAHAGVVNTLTYIRQLTNRKPFLAVLGGMHLLHAGEDRLDKTVRALKDLRVRRIGMAHCTGFAAMARLWQQLPDQCFHCTAGTQMDFG